MHNYENEKEYDTIYNILLVFVFILIVIFFLKPYFADFFTSKSYKNYANGTYKIGSTLPSGEYLIIPEGTSANVIYAKDEYALDIIYENTAINSLYINVEDGNYLIVNDNAKIYSSSSAPILKPEKNRYYDGMYKVGRDIQPGEYTFFCTDVDSRSGRLRRSGFIYISDFPNTIDDLLTCKSLVIGDMFASKTTTSSYTLVNGQYISISRAYAKNTSSTSSNAILEVHFDSAISKIIFLIIAFLLFGTPLLEEGIIKLLKYLYNKLIEKM